jgi:hypothetical protein
MVQQVEFARDARAPFSLTFEGACSLTISDQRPEAPNGRTEVMIVHDCSVRFLLQKLRFVVPQI